MSNESKDYEYEKRIHILSQLDRDGGLPEGWYKEVVPNMVEELVRALGPYIFDFEVLCCKEKYGSMRIYWAWSDPEVDWNAMYNKIEAILIKYEVASYHTCVECGAEATKYSDGWVLPYCESCFPCK